MKLVSLLHTKPICSYPTQDEHGEKVLLSPFMTIFNIHEGCYNFFIPNIFPSFKLSNPWLSSVSLKLYFPGLSSFSLLTSEGPQSMAFAPKAQHPNGSMAPTWLCFISSLDAILLSPLHRIWLLQARHDPPECHPTSSPTTGPLCFVSSETVIT